MSAVLVLFRRQVLFEAAMRAGDGNHTDKFIIAAIQIAKEKEFELHLPHVTQMYHSPYRG